MDTKPKRAKWRARELAVKIVEEINCPHCGQNLGLSPDAVDEIEVARIEGHASAKKEMIKKFAPVVDALEEIKGFMAHTSYCDPIHEAANKALESYRRKVLGEK